MRKKILFFSAVITTLSLMAFSWMNWNERANQPITEFNYGVDSRFGTTITKENLHKATSVLDIVPKEAEGWGEVSFQTVMIAIIQDDFEKREMGYHKTLNEAQIKLLQSTDYSTNFYIKARGKNKHPDTGKIEYYVYHLTIIPEKAAEYTDGQDVLISYLKENSKEETAIVKQDRLERGQISFIVSEEGNMSHVKLVSTSGYISIDKIMIDLITNLPGTWDPAANLEGEKVGQEFVFSFGGGGC